MMGDRCMDGIKKIIKSLFIGSLAGLAIALVTNYFVADLIDRLEDQTYYMRYRWEFEELPGMQKKQKTLENDYGIHIVDIDERSQQKLGNYWNWDRSFQAELIRNLSKHYPAAIVYDIQFFYPEDQNHAKRFEKLITQCAETNPSFSFPAPLQNAVIASINYDRQFIDATRQSGHVFHALCMSDKSDYSDFALSHIQDRMTAQWHDSLHPSSAIALPLEKIKAIPYDKKAVIDGIFPPLARAARDIGSVNIPKGKDGVIKEIPLLYPFGANNAVYLPISVRTAATLFGTPNDEILFEPGKCIDIGKPFKIFKDSSNRISFSYPNITVEFIKAILDRSKDILALRPGKSLDISTFCKIGKDGRGERFIEMFGSLFPNEIVQALLRSDVGAMINLPTACSLSLAPGIKIKRASDLDWTLIAGVGDGEWSLSRLDLQTLSHVSARSFDGLSEGQSKLLFNSMTISNKNNDLVSSLPIVRGRVLRELCALSWTSIENMKPGTRMDFGKSVRIPLNARNRHIVTYFGPKSKPFGYYSFYDIMKDRVQAQLEGKIFIVGSTIPAMFDIVSTPVDNPYPGVEVHASLLNSFLTDTFVTRLSAWQDFLIVLCIGIIVGFISFMLKPLFGGILTIVSIFAYFLIAMSVFGGDHVWIEIARPILAIILTFTAVMAYRYITEEKDRKFLQSTFKQYLSPELIDIMYKRKQTPKLGGDEGVRTAFFTDIQGFSTFSEKLGSPTRLVELLNEYLSEMTDTLLSHFGTLDKYEGDAIIAFFGAPMPMDDHAKQACLTALDMQDRLEQLRKKWMSEGNKWPGIVHEMRMRIGVNTGAITTGNMGSKVRMNYTMMGDAVNLAARLESAAKHYGVYTMISHYTHEFIKNDFETRQLDKITVVGKSEPVIVYELLSLKDKLSDQMSKLLQLYNQGLTYYYRQEWGKAVETFGLCEALEPNKIITRGITPSAVFLQRSKQYSINPPEKEWNGVYNLKSK
jgi:class 3 adenylate cyclase/CHASE2 domain-containing sensor protein